MKAYIRKINKKLLLIFAVVGPSIVTTMAGNDGGGVVTYSLAGATFGFGLLILLPFLTVIYGLTQEIGSRIAIVSGRGLADLIRERFGVRTSVVVFSLFFVANTGTLITNAAVIKSSLALFGVSPLWITIICIVIVVAVSFMVTRFDYNTNQRIFLASMFLYVAYAVSAVNVKPDWKAAFGALIWPTRESLQPTAIIASIAFVGTTITPWGQFFIQSFMKDKKLPLEHLSISRFEAYFGAFISNLCTFFIIVATSAALYDNHIILETGEQAALAIEPFAGKFASALFGVGFLNAGIIGIIIVGLSTSYAFTEFFGFEGTLDVGYAKGKNFYKLFYVQIVIAFIIVLFPAVSAFKIAAFSQSFNGILLPFIFYYLIRLSSDKGLMNNHAIDPVRRFLLSMSAVLIASASIFSIIYSIFYI